MSKFEHSFNIPFHQADPAGIMFYAHLFTHAHDAYAALMKACDFSLTDVLKEERYLIPIVHAEADYHLPMRHGDLISVSPALVNLGNSSFTLSYEFHSSNEHCASILTTHVFLAKNTQAATSIPDKLRNKIQALL